jgi:hypothetical protein
MLTDFSVYRYLVAVIFTALSYLVGFYIIQRKFKVLKSLLIGFVVVTIGYGSALLNFPIFLIVLMPIPFGLLLLYLFSDRNIKTTATTYILTWMMYIIFHIFLSYTFHFHSLIPSWKLSS